MISAFITAAAYASNQAEKRENSGHIALKNTKAEKRENSGHIALKNTVLTKPELPEARQVRNKPVGSQP